MEVMNAVRRGKAGPRQIAEIIGKDPGATARVLRIVNCSYFAIPSAPVSDIKVALAYLGLREVSRVVLTVYILQSLDGGGNLPGLTEYWVNSYHAALSAKRIAHYLRNSLDSTEGLYSATLLSGIGQLVYARFFPAHFTAVQEKMAAELIDFADAERALQYPSYQELGCQLAAQWQLPENIGDAIRCHTLSDLARLDSCNPDHKRPAVICLAQAMASATSGSLSPKHVERASTAVRTFLELSDDHFGLLLADIHNLRNDAMSAVDKLLAT